MKSPTSPLPRPAGPRPRCPYLDRLERGLLTDAQSSPVSLCGLGRGRPILTESSRATVSGYVLSLRREGCDVSKNSGAVTRAWPRFRYMISFPFGSRNAVSANISGVQKWSCAPQTTSVSVWMSVKPVANVEGILCSQHGDGVCRILDCDALGSQHRQRCQPRPGCQRPCGPWRASVEAGRVATGRLDGLQQF